MNSADNDNDDANVLLFSSDEHKLITNMFGDDYDYDYDKLPPIPAVQHADVPVQHAEVPPQLKDPRMLRSSWTPFTRDETYALIRIFDSRVSTQCDLETASVVREMFPCYKAGNLVETGDVVDWMYRMTNYKLVSLHRVQNVRQTEMHNAFAKAYGISNTTTVYHGCDHETANNVMKEGFRTGGGPRSLWGSGTYCGKFFPVAVQFAEPECGIQTILVCDFHKGHSKIGSPDLFNFGKTACGEQILTTTNDTVPPTIYCGSKDGQFSVTYKMCVQFDKRAGITQGNVDFMKKYGGSYSQGWKPPKINVPSHAPGSHMFSMGRQKAPLAPAMPSLGRPQKPLPPATASGSHVFSIAPRVAPVAPVTPVAPAVAPAVASVGLPKLLWYQQPSTLAHYSKAGCQASAPIMISEGSAKALTFEEPPVKVMTSLQSVDKIKVGDVVTIMNAVKLHKFCKGRQGHVKAILQESGQTPRFFIELIDASADDIRDIKIGNRTRKARYQGMRPEWLNSTYPEIELFTGLASSSVPTPLQTAASATASISFNASAGGSRASISVNFHGSDAAASVSAETLWGKGDGKRPHSDNGAAYHDGSKKHKQ